jgi:hypothetical protein
MNWDALGAVAELLGAGAVIATLLYLAKQLSHAANTSSSAATDRILRGFDEINRMIVSDGSLRETLLKESQLTASENEQYFQLVVLYCNIWISAQSEYDSGQISEDLYNAAAADVQVEIDRWPRFKEFGELWLERFPQVGTGAIFEPLRKVSS